jgi:uncharacterized membrane protein YkoI
MGKLLAGMAVVVLVAAGAWAGGEGEKTIPLDKVPKKVMAAVKAKYPKATVRGASKEMDKDKVVYEIAITYKKQKIDVSLTPAGKIIATEAEIAMKDVPKSVAKALKSKYPKATVKLVEKVTNLAEKVTKDKKVSYEFQIVTADDQRLEVTFSAVGKFLTEKKVPAKEEKEEKKDSKK